MQDLIKREVIASVGIGFQQKNEIRLLVNIFGKKFVWRTDKTDSFDLRQTDFWTRKLTKIYFVNFFGSLF